MLNNFGRRRIFNYGMVVLTTLLLLIGIMDVVPTTAAKWVQAACTVVYAFVYFLTIGAVAFVLLGEVSSPAMRASTAALATITQSLFGLVMNFAIPYMVNPDEANLKGKVGFIFGGLALIATVGSFWLVPELKGRTFAEIDHMFQSKVPPEEDGSICLVKCNIESPHIHLHVCCLSASSTIYDSLRKYELRVLLCQAFGYFTCESDYL